MSTFRLFGAVSTCVFSTRYGRVVGDVTGGTLTLYLFGHGTLVIDLGIGGIAQLGIRIITSVL